MAKNNKKYIKSILFGRHLQEKGFVSRENIKYFSKGAIYKKKDSNNIKIINFFNYKKKILTILKS